MCEVGLGLGWGGNVFFAQDFRKSDFYTLPTYVHTYHLPFVVNLGRLENFKIIINHQSKIFFRLKKFLPHLSRSAGVNECMDGKTAKYCTPKFENIAVGKSFQTTQTCGTRGPERYCQRIKDKRHKVNSHAGGMAYVLPYGFEIDFVRNPISGSASRFLLIILKFIVTLIFEIKIRAKKFLDTKKILFSKSDLYKSTCM